MKIIKLLSAMVLSLVALSCSAQKTLSEVASIKGVSSVYIGKAMLRLASSPGIDLTESFDPIDLGMLMSNVDSIEIIDCEEAQTIPQVEEAANRALGQYPFELLAEVNDEGDKVEISGLFKDGSADTLTMLLIKAQEENEELTYILMKGEIPLATLQSAIR